MKENYTALYPNQEVAKNVQDYAHQHSTPLPQHIIEHHAWGSEQPKANYMISPLQAQFQIFIAKAVGAKRILEIGTYIGFSALGWASAVGADGQVTCLEYDAGFAKTAEETYAKNGLKNVSVIVGDAGKTIPELAKSITEPYDLIFIDADKISYPKYLSQILSLSQPSTTGTRLLKPHGLLVTDNTLRRGLVADDSDANPFSETLFAAKELTRQRGEGQWKDGDLEALRTFNDEVVKSERLTSFLLPLFDGVGMAVLED